MCIFFTKRQEALTNEEKIRIHPCITKEQNPERQYQALEKIGVDKKNIYEDKMSGHNFARPAYKRMIKKMKRNDVLVIKSIDRLGRNYSEILEQWRIFTKEKKIDIQVIDMPLLNTDSKTEGLTGTFISDLVLQILAYVAETERNFIKQRQAEGIAIAKAKGVQFGRGRKEMPEEFENYYKKWKEGEISVREAGKILGISHTTFYRRCKEKEEKCNKM